MSINKTCPANALPSRQTCQLSHGRLTYRTTGSGQSIVFLHGLLGNAKSWTYQFQDPRLTSAYRMIAWDAPGFGESDLLPAEIDAYVTALAEFIAAVADGPVHLVGHSMGGTLALAAEVASEVRPEGLRRATRMLQLADNRPLLPALKVPTLILTGGADRVVQPWLRADLLALTPHEQHIEMPGLGHGPYFEAPAYYNGLIADFLPRP